MKSFFVFLCALVIITVGVYLFNRQTTQNGQANASPSPAAPYVPFKPGLVESKGKGKIRVISATQGMGSLQRGKSVMGGPLKVADQTFSTGLGTHSPSRIVLELQPGFKTFSGSCGLDKEVGNDPKVIFKIISGGKLLFQSPVLNGGQKAYPFSISIRGLSTIELVTEGKTEDKNPDSGGHDDWIDLRLQ